MVVDTCNHPLHRYAAVDLVLILVLILGMQVEEKGGRRGGRSSCRGRNIRGCCGGGGGLVALGEETLDFRMKSSRIKADQVKDTGAIILATACENCHTQLSNLNDHYKMNVQVEFLSSMVAELIRYIPPLSHQPLIPVFPRPLHSWLRPSTKHPFLVEKHF